MATCITCGRDTRLFSEFCDDCKEKHLLGGKRGPVRWETVFRVVIVSLLGFIPSVLVSIIALGILVTVPDSLSGGRYITGILKLGFFPMAVFGTYALCRYLFGKPLHELRSGMIVGLATMVVMVVQVPVRVYLDGLGVQDMLPKENLALAVGAMNGVIAIIPLVVYSYLAYYSWKVELRAEFQHAAS